MKRLTILLICGLLAGCQWASFRERYNQTPVQVHQAGEGRTEKTFHTKTYVYEHRWSDGCGTYQQRVYTDRFRPDVLTGRDQWVLIGTVEGDQ